MESSKESNLIGNVLKDSSTFVEKDALVGDQSRHIALGVDQVEVSIRRGLVSLDINLLDVDDEASSHGSNERGSTARGGGVVKLGHCEKMVAKGTLECTMKSRESTVGSVIRRGVLCGTKRFVDRGKKSIKPNNEV